MDCTGNPGFFRRATGVVHVVRDEARIVARNREPVRVLERRPNIIEPGLPVVPHRVDAELVVLVMPLVRLVFEDELKNIDRSPVSHFLRFPDKRMVFLQTRRDVLKQFPDELRMNLVRTEHCRDGARAARVLDILGTLAHVQQVAGEHAASTPQVHLEHQRLLVLGVANDFC